MPCLITHGSVISAPRCGSQETPSDVPSNWCMATGLEHLGMQGFLLHEPVGKFGFSKMLKVFKDLRIDQQKMTAGNGMSLVSQSAFMFYILSNVSMRAAAGHEDSPPNSGDEL